MSAAGEFKKPLFDTPRFYMAHTARQYSQAQGSHETLAQSTAFVLPAARNDVTTAEERRVIHGVLEPLYARVCEIEAVDLFTGGLLDNAAQVTV